MNSKSFFANRDLVLALGIVNLIVIMEIPIWYSACVCIFWGWKWAIEKNWVRQLGRLWTGVLAILALIFLWWRYQTVLDQESATVFLIILMALKVMDYEKEWDHRFLVLLGFLVVAIKFLFTIDWYWILPGATVFILLWKSLLDKSVQNPYRFLIRNLIFSVPLIVALFIFFPRFTLNIMRRAPTGMASVGFSDSISPGDVAGVFKMGELVFRAQFEYENKMAIEKLYWRGSAFDESNGLRWTRTRFAGASAPSNSLKQEAEYTYTITLEPQNHNYLFTLDYPIRVDMESAKPNRDNLDAYHVIYTLPQRISYRGSSTQGRTYGKPSEQLLQIPVLPPKTQDWVNANLKKLKTYEEKMQVLETFFYRNGFRYTLKPGSYTQTGLDEFLFKRKLGFCEHYAAAYATLARALGIPARIVTGYQGGKWNEVGKFYRVTQADAHAWVEVLDPNLKWTRIDPTEWIAPLRISIGGEDYFSLPEDQRFAILSEVSERRKQLSQLKVWDYVDFWIENFNYRWTNWLLDFDREKQNEFASMLGLKSGVFIFGFIVLIFLITQLFSARTGEQKKNYLQKLYFEIEKWAYAKGVTRTTSEAPLSFLVKLEQQFPEKADSLHMIQEVFLGGYSDDDFQLTRKKYFQLKNMFFLQH